MRISNIVNNIDKLKCERQVTYSEQLFDIPNPPEHQCSNIDNVISAINTIEKLIKRHERFDEDELRSVVSDIEYEISGLEKEVENIRTAIEGVREWGQSWKDKFKKVVNRDDFPIEIIS